MLQRLGRLVDVAAHQQAVQRRQHEQRRRLARQETAEVPPSSTRFLGPPGVKVREFRST
jgi:hypothetical protein